MASKKEAKLKVKKVIDKFKRREANYPKKKLSEIGTQITFINELFEALGWDVKQDKSFEEVEYEEKAGEGRVDYSFRIEGITQFVLEAKKISTDLNDVKWWDQAVIYGYNKGVTYAILTNFKRLIVFNTEEDVDSPRQSKILDLSYDEYLTSFDKLWWLSKEGMNEGILDRETEQRGAKRKRTPIDKQLLNDILHWRNELFNDIKQNNKGYEDNEVEDMIQILLNRFIFIRTCEDRCYVDPVLREKIHWWGKHPQKHLINLIEVIFMHFRDVYDSGLFEDKSCDHIKITDKLLNKIIHDFYYSRKHDLTYDFSAIDVDVMGEIYELYIGHLTKRQDEGIYYTPRYIVDYIVERAISEYLKTHKNLDGVKILDSACGSGSFLLRAFQELIDFAHGKGNKEVPYTKKERILLKSIYGVDLDKRAAEIAKLNLSLKTLTKEKSLPHLDRNIKIGNSVVDDNKIVGSKAFKWELEFKEIMRKGGFDILISNPPYLGVKGYSKDERRFLEEKYTSIKGKSDIFFSFIENGLNRLNKEGILSFIIPRYWLESDYGKELRKLLKEKTCIRYIIDFRDTKIFESAGVHCCVILVQKKEESKEKEENMIKSVIVENQFEGESLFEQNLKLMNHIVNKIELPNYEDKYISTISKKQKMLKNIWTFEPKVKSKIFEKIKTIANHKLDDVAVIHEGINTGADSVSKSHIKNLKLRKLKDGEGIFVLEDHEKKKLSLSKSEKKNIKKWIKGSDVNKWVVKGSNKWLIYFHNDVKIRDIPNIHTYLKRFRKILNNRAEIKRNKKRKWYQLAWARETEVFERKNSNSIPKILVPYKSDRCRCALDFDNYFTSADFRLINTKKDFNPFVLIAILNSKVIEFYMKFLGKKLGKMIEFYSHTINDVPIVYPTEEKIINKIEELVNQLISWSNELAKIQETNLDRKKKILAEIEKTEENLNNIIYKLYNLTNKEKKIIEEI